LRTSAHLHQHRRSLPLFNSGRSLTGLRRSRPFTRHIDLLATSTCSGRSPEWRACTNCVLSVWGGLHRNPGATDVSTGQRGTASEASVEIRFRCRFARVSTPT
jgi:hypothetical protein